MVRSGRVARLAFLGALALLAAGCEEVRQGPRFVPYSETEFYIRHAPLGSHEARVDRIAKAACAEVGREPLLTAEHQVYPFDLRDATYTCVEP
jgi:hypothetical protein